MEVTLQQILRASLGRNVETVIDREALVSPVISRFYQPFFSNVSSRSSKSLTGKLEEEPHDMETDDLPVVNMHKRPRFDRNSNTEFSHTYTSASAIWQTKLDKAANCKPSSKTEKGERFTETLLSFAY